MLLVESVAALVCIVLAALVLRSRAPERAIATVPKQTDPRRAS
jgi:hypothetical protein